MNRQDYFDNLENLTAEIIADGIIHGVITLDELRKYATEGNIYFGHDKQKSVKEILRKRDDDAFSSSKTIEDLMNYLSAFKDGNHIDEAKANIRRMTEIKNAEEIRLIERERMLKKINGDINEYTPDEIISNFGHDIFDQICQKLTLNKEIITDYTEPHLGFGRIPIEMDDIPAGFTDVFFWGIPSSGKTCALSVILNTMNKTYTLTDPNLPTKFGTQYRDNLINNIFVRGQYGYLPDSTAKERTQYMPFFLKKKGENKYRQLSFFELSGEVFKYFYDIVYDTAMTREEEAQKKVEIGFNTLDLLLNSKNQKIHFFFIDYNQESKGTRDKYGLTQNNYLRAATAYFNDRNDIFKKKTDAVYVVVTKSDQIQGDNRTSAAQNFLQENFSGFLDALKTRCKKDSIDFKVKMFSIGDVYFKRICKINREYATDIIEELLQRVKPANESKIGKLLNS